MTPKRTLKTDSAAAWGAAALFAAVVSALKIQQVWRLQSQAWDLGIHANMLWNTAHGRWFWDSIKGVNYLGDHFSPSLALLAPLLRLWPDASVLCVAQTLALALGLPAVHRLTLEKTGDRTLAAGLTLLYAFSPLVHGVSRDDVHAVAFAVPLLLWGLILPGARGLALLAAAGTLQEDLWLCAAAAAWHRKERVAAAAFVAAFLVSLLLLRAVGGGFKPLHWDFYRPAAIAASLFRPDRLVGLARLLLPLGGLQLFGGADALPLLAPLGYTWAGASPHQGRLELHYAAPLIPFAFLAAAAGLRRLKLKPWAFAALVLLGAFWLPRYSRPLTPEKTRAAAELMALVPKDAPVIASFNLVPSLALRPEIKMWRAGVDPAGYWIALDAAPPYFELEAGNDLQTDSAVREFITVRLDRVVYASEWLCLLRPRLKPDAVGSP